MHIFHFTTTLIIATVTVTVSINQEPDIRNNTSWDHTISENITLPIQLQNEATKTKDGGCVGVQGCQTVKPAAPSNTSTSTDEPKEHCHENGWPCLHYSSCCSQICQWTWPGGYPIPIRQCV